jgi:preprotein translocase subunit SecE
MAKNEAKANKKLTRKRKQAETVRQKAEKESVKRKKPTKVGAIKQKVHKPLSTLGRVASKEYHPIKVPDKKGVRVLNKRVKYIPQSIKNSWAELKQVTWPSRKDALKLSFAVIIFSICFAVFVQVLDFLFSKVVKEIILR